MYRSGSPSREHKLKAEDDGTVVLQTIPFGMGCWERCLQVDHELILSSSRPISTLRRSLSSHRLELNTPNL